MSLNMMRALTAGSITFSCGGGIPDSWNDEHRDIDRWENDGGRCPVARQGF